MASFYRAFRLFSASSALPFALSAVRKSDEEKCQDFFETCLLAFQIYQLEF